MPVDSVTPQRLKTRAGGYVQVEWGSCSQQYRWWWGCLLIGPQCYTVRKPSTIFLVRGSHLPQLARNLLGTTAVHLLIPMSEEQILRQQFNSADSKLVVTFLLSTHLLNRRDGDHEKVARKSTGGIRSCVHGMLGKHAASIVRTQLFQSNAT